MATHSSILAWKIPWTEKNAHEKAHWIGYSPWGHKRVGQDLMTKQQQIYIHADTHTPSIYTYICVRVQSLSCVQLFAIPWTVSLPGSSVHGIFQARILECLPFSPPGDLPNPGMEPVSAALAGEFFTAKPLGSPFNMSKSNCIQIKALLALPQILQFSSC